MRQKIIISLFAVLVPWGNFSNIWALINNCNYWKASDETLVAAGTSFINDDILIAKMAYGTTLKNAQKEFAGETFSHYIQVRVSSNPTVDEPNGTNQIGSTSVILTAKKDMKLKIYYYRQSTVQNVDGGVYASNDGKDLKIVNQATPNTVLDGTLNIVEETDDFKYAWVTKEYKLLEGNNYTLWVRGTTIRLYGMAYEIIENSVVEIDGIYYNLNQEKKEAEVTINGITEQHYSGTIVIPTTVDYNGSSYSVTSIGENALRSCSTLMSVTIPNSVTTIGNNAFAYCSGLTSLTIPNNVIDIGDNVFEGCTNLISMTLPNNIATIGKNAFLNCTNLTSVIIGNSVTAIGKNAFYGCNRLVSVTIPQSVTTIGTGAFHGCSRLVSVNITNIAAWCNIELSDTDSNPLTYAHHLYLDNEEVKDLIIPNNVTTIGKYAFSDCYGLTSLTISSSVTSIGQSAFQNCSNLTSLIISSSVTSIGQSAFQNCSNLTSVTIPNSVTSIRNMTFYGCSSLTSVTIGNSVTSIGSSAFQGCSDLSSVNIGKEVKNIGVNAFAQCPEIKEVYCYAKDVPTISSDAFEDSYYIKFATLYVPEASVDLYKASTWSQFGNIVGITGGDEGERCEKPVITLLANGKIKVESATEGATCVTNITASNAEPLTDGEISLSTPLTVYTVTSYATKEGYDDSEVATATFRYEKAEGDINGDGNLNISDVVQLVNMILGK